MKLLLIAISFLGLNMPPAEWSTDFAKSQELALKTHKNILLNFSGSDWCGPCIRMHREIFETSDFLEFAEENLLLVNADFPRLKKHALSPALQTQNERLAEKYNKEGAFPLTLLLTPEGKVLKSWNGCPNISAKQFTEEVKLALGDHN